MEKRKIYALLVGILVLATFLRFYHLRVTPPGLYLDEAMDGNDAAEAALKAHYHVFYTADNGREGLYVNIIGLMLQFFHPPHEPWVLRSPAAVAGVLTVLGLYLITAELFGSSTGLLAAFLLATSFWHINFSRIGFRAILSPLFLTWSLFFLLKAFKTARPTAAMGSTIAAGALYALGFYTYLAYRVTPLLFLVFIPFYRTNPAFWKRVAVFVAVTFVVAAPIGWHFIRNPRDFFGHAAQISVTNEANPIRVFAVNLVKTLGMLVFHGDHNWRHNLSGAPELFKPVGILFVMGLVLDVFWLARSKCAEDARGAFGLWLTIAWLVLAAIPAAASTDGIPHALRSILMLPPAITLAALAGIWLYQVATNKWGAKIARPLAVAFLIVVGIYGYYEYFVLWAKNPNVPGAFNQDYVDVGRALNALPSAAPKYVFVDARGVFVNGIPMLAETTMFITDTFLPNQQAAKNIHYVLSADQSTFPSNSLFFHIFYNKEAP